MASEATNRKKVNRLSSIFSPSSSASSSPTSASSPVRVVLSKPKPRAMTDSMDASKGGILPVLRFSAASISYEFRSSSPESMPPSQIVRTTAGAMQSYTRPAEIHELPPATAMTASRAQTVPNVYSSRPVQSETRIPRPYREAARQSTLPHVGQTNIPVVQHRGAARMSTTAPKPNRAIFELDATTSPPLPPAARAPRASRSSSSSSILYPLPQPIFHSYTQANNSSPQLTSANALRVEPDTRLAKRRSENQLRHPSVSAAAVRSASAHHHQKKPSIAVPNSVVHASYNFAGEPDNKKLSYLKNYRRMSWLPKSRMRKNVVPTPVARAWIASKDGSRPPYDVSMLVAGEKCEELWNEQGNCRVYLFPRKSGRGPSFKIDAALFSSSAKLTKLAYGQIYSGHNTSQTQISAGQVQSAGTHLDSQTQQLHYNVPGSPPMGPSPNASYSDGSVDYQNRNSFAAEDVELWLKVPLTTYDGVNTKFTDDDLERLILVRNLFAFLQGGRLVGTAKYPTFFMLFRHIARMLSEYGFTNLDQSSFGEVATASFNAYVQELELDDVRESADKNLEALIMSEGMKSSMLWNEAFPHGVGRLQEMVALNSIKYTFLSPTCIKRLERDSHFLEKQLDRINARLSNFEYPELFRGIMNSQTAPEREVAHFEEWKTAFHKTRTFLLNYLKQKYGAWPPRKAKKNITGLEGLNRRVLQDLYAELTALYEAMVDRQHPSPRLNQQEDNSELTHGNIPDHPDRRIEALRKVLKEYDYSSPPVYPPMMFDGPLLPRNKTVAPVANSDSESKRPPEEKLSKSTLISALKNSYHRDVRALRPNILMRWQEFEQKATRGMQLKKLGNFRLGSWLFFYVVLQALPMVTVDAPGLNYTEGVEYFLGQPAKGRLPWSPQRVAREFYRDPLTGNVVQTTADAVELSIEAVYKRAMCWKLGEGWAQSLPIFARDSVDESRPVVHRQARSSTSQSEVPFETAKPFNNRPLDSVQQQQPPYYQAPPPAQYAELPAPVLQLPYEPPQQRARSEYFQPPVIQQSDAYLGQSPPVQLSAQVPVRPLTMISAKGSNLSDPQLHALPPTLPGLQFNHSRDSSPGNARPVRGNRNSSLLAGLGRVPDSIHELHPLDIPPVMPGARDTWSASSGSRDSSPGSARRRGGGVIGGNRNSSLITGLERMPYQFPSAPTAQATPDSASRSASGSITFDQILKAHAIEEAAEKSKGKVKKEDKSALRGRGKK